MRVALGAAALAAALAVPAHAATASGIQMGFDLSGTCPATGFTCTATLTTTSCIERQRGPRCSADPVSLTLTARSVGVCQMTDFSRSLIVHTEAYGDVRVFLNAVVYAGGWSIVGIPTGGPLGAFVAVGGFSVPTPGPCPASFDAALIGALGVVDV